MKASIAENIRDVSRHIRLFEQKYEREHDSVQLLAVSKTQVTEKILQAQAVGQQDFAENYLQEALDKISELDKLTLNWHFIGPIQSNKTRTIAENFSWVHSLDRSKIAQRLNDHRPAALPPLNVLIQVNLDQESTKSGCSLAQLPELARVVNNLPQLMLSGLMTIPTPTNNFDAQRKVFRRLTAARDSLLEQGFKDCQHLSMGMSQDFEAAIAEGATIIRIGTAIFGPRDSKLSTAPPRK